MGEITNTVERKISTASVRAEIAFKKKMKSFQQSGEQMTEDLEAALFAQCLALQKLKAPTSAVFPELDEMIVIGGDGSYTVSGYVDSQNENGVMIRDDFTFNVEKNDGRWMCLDQLEEPATRKQGEYQDPSNQSITRNALKFCKHCGAQIDADCIICPKCGKQVEQLRAEPAQPQVVINNSNNNNNQNVNTNVNTNINGRLGRRCNKWTAFFLCLFLGWIGVHKFYEGKRGMGFLYMFTWGLFFVGWIIDTIAILLKPNPYYV